MTSGENNRALIFLVGCGTADYTIVFKQQMCHLRLEMHLATTTKDGVAHILNDTRQLVCADMRMRISEDIRRGTMLTEHVEYLLDIATLLAAGVELAITIGTCPTLAKTVVALRVNLLRLGNLRQVLLALMHILTTFQHDGAQAKLNQSERSKKSTRTSTHDNHLRLVADIRIIHRNVFIVLRLFVDIDAHFQVDKDSTLTSVNATTQDAHTRHCAHIKAILVGKPTT